MTFKGYKKEQPKVGDFIHLIIKRGGISLGTNGFIYEISENGNFIKLMDAFGNKAEKQYPISYFDKAKIKRVKTSFNQVGEINDNTADNIGKVIIGVSIIALLFKLR